MSDTKLGAVIVAILLLVGGSVTALVLWTSAPHGVQCLTPSHIYVSTGGFAGPSTVYGTDGMSIEPGEAVGAFQVGKRTCFVTDNGGSFQRVLP